MLTPIAEEYIRLVLAAGRHDENLVDAYYGPPGWRDEIEDADPVPPHELRARAAGLLERVRGAAPSDRRTFLETQLVALETFLRLLQGAGIPLAEEVRLLYDVDPPTHGVEEFAAARARLDGLLPGDGALRDRVRTFRDRFVVPEERLEDVVRVALDAARERTAGLVELPGDETFRVSYATGKPWSAYNWYQGGHTSLIEVNVDLPVELGPVFRTLAHEGYPGHHTYNVLLESHLVEGRGWPEYRIHPLFSPLSLLAEGTANAGMSVIFPGDEEWTFLEEVLAPAAGLQGLDFARYRDVLDALRPLRHVRPEAARLLLDGGAPPEQVAAFLVEHALNTEERAAKAVEFIRTYRSYIFNYTTGEDLVLRHIGDGGDRATRFFDLLRRPVTPSALTAPPAGGASRPGERQEPETDG